MAKFASKYLKVHSRPISLVSIDNFLPHYRCFPAVRAHWDVSITHWNCLHWDMSVHHTGVSTALIMLHSDWLGCFLFKCNWWSEFTAWHLLSVQHPLVEKFTLQAWINRVTALYLYTKPGLGKHGQVYLFHQLGFWRHESITLQASWWTEGVFVFGPCRLNCHPWRLKVGWRGKLFWLVRISVSQNFPKSNKSSYWAGDVIKTKRLNVGVLKWAFIQLKFSRMASIVKRHRNGSTLLYLCPCAMGSQSPTSRTLSHFWLLG